MLYIQKTGKREDQEMFDKFIYQGLHFIMKWAGTLNAWAWRKHTKILRNKQRQEDEEYVKELKNKL